MSIRAHQLTKKYGEQTAVANISFDIPTGQVVGFLGPNGAGKSTTMKMLTCYLAPSEGDAYVNDFTVRDESSKVKASVGYLPEHNPLYPEMFVREYLSFVADLSGMRKGVKERVEEVIGQTGLTRESNKRIQQLSKGYRQRVGLAQALIHDPDVLILDEPTSGLDPNQVSEIRKLIKEISLNKTILLSTHIMQEVEAMCDRVIIIKSGKIVADDLLEALKTGDETHIHNVRFKREIDIGKLSSLEGVKEVKDLSDGRYRLSVIKGTTIEESLFQLAVDEGNILLEQSTDSESLEDVFRNLTEDKNG